MSLLVNVLQIKELLELSVGGQNRLIFFQGRLIMDFIQLLPHIPLSGGPLGQGQEAGVFTSEVNKSSN